MLGQFECPHCGKEYEKHRDLQRKLSSSQQDELYGDGNPIYVKMVCESCENAFYISIPAARRGISGDQSETLLEKTSPGENVYLEL